MVPISSHAPTKICERAVVMNDDDKDISPRLRALQGTWAQRGRKGKGRMACVWGKCGEERRLVGECTVWCVIHIYSISCSPRYIPLSGTDHAERSERREITRGRKGCGDHKHPPTHTHMYKHTVRLCGDNCSGKLRRAWAKQEDSRVVNEKVYKRNENIPYI